MAFHDEGDPPPTRAGARRAGGASSAQAVRNRRLVVLAFGALLLILLAVLVDGCLDSRAENALKDYNRDVSSIVRRSDGEVARPFFDLLQRGRRNENEFETAINRLRDVSTDHTEDAEAIDVPEELRGAHRNLLLVLGLRTDGLERIARQIRTALADTDSGAEASAAVERIAGDMQYFLSSDVVYDARVRRSIGEVLDEKEIGGQDVADSQFLPSLSLLTPRSVGELLGGAGQAGRTDEEAAPGRHGHALESVSVGGVTLQPEGAANSVAAGADLGFVVAFANQGDNDEVDVPIRVRIGGGDGAAPITITRRVERTAAGDTAEATIPLSEAPPIGVPLTVEVSVERVPGEQLVDNNSQEYSVTFTR